MPASCGRYTEPVGRPAAPHYRLLMVTREWQSDRRYGLGRSVLPVIDELQRRGWSTRYLTQVDLPQRRHERRKTWLTRLFRIPGLRKDFSCQNLLRAWAERVDMGFFAAEVSRREGFDLVHLHDPWIASGFRIGAWWLRLRGVSWGVTEHGFGSYSRATHDDGLIQSAKAQRFLRYLETGVLAAAHWVVSPTQLALAQLARDLGMPGPAPHWHAVAHARPSLAPLSTTEARRQLGWAKGDVYVLGVGRLVPLKQFHLLVAACTELASRHPNLHLVLLGDGDREALELQAAAAGFGDRLHVTVTDDPAPYYRAADIYASTSATESFGLANLEALVAGLPAVCTAVGGVPEVVGDGAWLIPSDDRVLVRVLSSLLESADARTDLARRAQQQAAESPDLHTVTNHYVSIYQSAADATAT